MAIIDWDLHYDRRATAGFLAHFLHGGVAESLAEYARYAPYAVDLQMRKNPKTGAEHATLYVGLTSVLQVTWPLIGTDRSEWFLTRAPLLLVRGSTRSTRDAAPMSSWRSPNASPIRQPES